jgi:hypothetical protein
MLSWMVATSMFLKLSNPAWTAIGTWAAVAVALGAVIVARRIANSQLGDAKRSRREQAQPYVAVYMEHSPTGPFVIDLVIKNFGRTAAHDVKIDFDPAPKIAATDGEHLWLPDTIPVLVPGQEWRTFWDTTIARAKSSLPTRYTATVEFSDTRGKLGPYTFVIDWKHEVERGLVETYGVHHVADALRDIRGLLSGWKEPRGTGLRVYSRDGDALDEREAERYKRVIAEQEQQRRDDERAS